MRAHACPNCDCEPDPNPHPYRVYTAAIPNTDSLPAVTVSSDDILTLAGVSYGGSTYTYGYPEPESDTDPNPDTDPSAD